MNGSFPLTALLRGFSPFSRTSSLPFFFQLGPLCCMPFSPFALRRSTFSSPFFFFASKVSCPTAENGWSPTLRPVTLTRWAALSGFFRTGRQSFFAELLSSNVCSPFFFTEIRSRSFSRILIPSQGSSLPLSELSSASTFRHVTFPYNGCFWTIHGIVPDTTAAIPLF